MSGFAESRPAATAAETDARLMAATLALGDRGLGTTWPNPSVGALVVRDQAGGPVIVGRGWTRPGGRPHAETEALTDAGDATAGASLYVSLEPCAHHGKTPPCADAIIRAGIRRVVAALEDPDPRTAGQGFARLEAAGIEVVRGVLADQARRSHAGHIRRIQDRRPHVMLKLAVSSDGKAAHAGPRPAAITGAPSRAYVHRLRAAYDAIMVGIGTVLADDPELTCRLPGLLSRSPVRIVVDAELRLPLGSRLVGSAGRIPVWVVTGATASTTQEHRLLEAGVQILRVPTGSAGLDPHAALTQLAARGITRLMVEGGPRVAAALLGADLIDEAILLTGPNPLGDDALPALAGLPLSALTASPNLVVAGRDRIGDDELLHLWRP